MANVVDGVLRACEAPDVAGEVINVATGGRISLNELLATMCSACSARRSRPIYGRPRAGDVRDSQADIAKAARLLGYAPIVTFEEGLRRTVEWAAGRPLPRAVIAPLAWKAWPAAPVRAASASRRRRSR